MASCTLLHSPALILITFLKVFFSYMRKVESQFSSRFCSILSDFV